MSKARRVITAVAAHLARDSAVTKVPATSPIWRILKGRGFVAARPQKRPRSAWKRFCAALRPPAPALSTRCDAAHPSRLTTSGSRHSRPEPPAPHRVKYATTGHQSHRLDRRLNIHVLDRNTGTLIRKLVSDATRDYQPRGAPERPKTEKAAIPAIPMKVQSYSDVLRHH